MSAYAPAALKSVYTFVRQYVTSVKDGGTLANKSGYHNTRNRLLATPAWRNDYSTKDARDKQGDGDAAAAFDLTMSDVDMRKTTARVIAAMRARDPRIVGKLREWGGTLDSRTVTAYRIEDQTRISFDKTHLWHGHGSVFRKYANDAEVALGIAQVIAGVSAEPYVWDGKSFPGAERLQLGSEGPWVTWLGERLIAHGWTGYTTGAGPTLTEVDVAAVRWIQEKQGFTGKDADGIAGATTWAYLASEPAVVVPSHPALYPEPVTNLVYQEVLVDGQKDSDSVWQLQFALRKLGYSVELTGAYDAQTVEGVKRWQASIGDTVQDGLVGPLQTAKVFKDAGMAVQLIPVQEPAQPEPPVVVPKPPTKPPTKPEVPVATTATETIFGWNILRRTDDLAGRDRYSARKPRIGKTLRDAKASVYLLIETDQTSRRDCGEALGSNFTWWGYKYYGIYWDQRVWERTGDATNEAALGENRFLLSLPLRHKATGAVVNFDVSHLENDGDPTSDGHKARFSQTTKIVAKASKGNRVGFADINSTTPGIIANPTARQKQKPRYLLVKAGARLVTSLGSKVKNLAYGSHHGGKGGTKGPLIDEAWVFGDVEIVDAEIVRTDTTDASDHNGIKLRIKF